MPSYGQDNHFKSLINPDDYYIAYRLSLKQLSPPNGWEELYHIEISIMSRDKVESVGGCPKYIMGILYIDDYDTLLNDDKYFTIHNSISSLGTNVATPIALSGMFFEFLLFTKEQRRVIPISSIDTKNNFHVYENATKESYGPVLAKHIFVTDDGFNNYTNKCNTKFTLLYSNT